MNSLQESAWLAGLLEGEGCFRVGKSAARPQRRAAIEVSLKMTDKDVVVRATEVMPTSRKVAVRKDERRPTFTDCYAISWGGIQAENLMRRVLPYMGERRKAKIEECLATPNLSHHGRKAKT